MRHKQAERHHREHLIAMGVEEIDEALQAGDPPRRRLAGVLYGCLQRREPGRPEASRLRAGQQVGEQREMHRRLVGAPDGRQHPRPKTEREGELHRARREHRPGPEPAAYQAPKAADVSTGSATASARSSTVTRHGSSFAQRDERGGIDRAADVLAEQRHRLAQIEARHGARRPPAAGAAPRRAARGREANGPVSPRRPGSAPCTAARRASRDRRDRDRARRDGWGRESARRSTPFPAHAWSSRARPGS